MEFPTKNLLRKSGIIFSLMLLVIFTLIPYLLHREIRLIPLIFALIIFIISIISPYSLRKPYKLWIKLGDKLGKINSKLILSLFFYLLITPAAIFKAMISLIKVRKPCKSYYSDPVSTKPQNPKDQY